MTCLFSRIVDWIPGLSPTDTKNILLWEQGVVSSNLTSPTSIKLVASATSFLRFG